MKKIISILLVCTFAYAEISAQNVTLMSYNIRYDSPNDGENNWQNRKEFLAKQIEFHKADIIGTQEGMRHQLTYLDSFLVDYKFVGSERDGKRKGEHTAIFFNILKVKMLQTATFWLSLTPNKASVGWDAAHNRICTYAYFEDIESGEKFWVFNTHFDHIGEEARKNSAKLILKQIKNLTSYEEAVVLMGDFNLESNSEAIKEIESEFLDSYKFSKFIFGEAGTFNDFKYNEKATKRIDYIFVLNKFLNVRKYATLNNSYNFKFPSDHFPVFTEMLFREISKD